MRTIPLKIRRQLDQDPNMHICCVQDENCAGRIEWHHPFIYSEKQINEIWGIIGICAFHHRKAESKELRPVIHGICLSKATEEDLAKYPRKDWGLIRSNSIFPEMSINYPEIIHEDF